MVIILDLGSGETCWNNREDVRDMIMAVDDVDPREHEIILKWQLFRGGEFAHLRALHHGIFAYAYDVAREYGYATTASVFDWQSAEFLSRFDIPFIKLACLPELTKADSERSIESLIPTKLGKHGHWTTPLYDAVVASYGSQAHFGVVRTVTKYCLACVREYPAKLDDYEKAFTSEQLEAGISDHSDHTKGMYLFNEYKPDLYETHFCLDRQTGPDTGPFALRPKQLRDMLEAL